VSLLGSAATTLRLLRQLNVDACLIGGLAVSARCDPRFTRDIDLAVVIADDRRSEQVVQALGSDGYSVMAVIEQQVVGRMAMVRLAGRDGVSVDLLMASSGIEPEIVGEAEVLEVVRGTRLPVARTGHLMALKLLSVAPGRETDAADLRQLALIADSDEWNRAAAAVDLIQSRGFARGRTLSEDLIALRESLL
jgi:hypothetical protein